MPLIVRLSDLNRKLFCVTWWPFRALTSACTKTPEEKPKCVDCDGEHPASHSQCSKILSYRNALLSKPKTSKAACHPANPTPKAPAPAKPATRQATSRSKERPDASIDDITSLMEQVERTRSICNVNSLLNKLKKLNDDLENCKTEGEQLLVLLNATR